MSINNTSSQITITPISALIDEPVQILPSAGPMILQFGGTLKDSAFADADSWQHVLSFLQENFGSSETAQRS